MSQRQRGKETAWPSEDGRSDEDDLELVHLPKAEYDALEDELRVRGDLITKLNGQLAEAEAHIKRLVSLLKVARTTWQSVLSSGLKLPDSMPELIHRWLARLEYFIPDDGDPTPASMRRVEPPQDGEG